MCQISCYSLWIVRLQSYLYILSLSLFMVHDSKVTLIMRYIFRIFGNVNNETHGCISHAAPMSKFKEELEHYIEHCQMFRHHFIFIGAFIAWVRHPSILFTSSLEGALRLSSVSSSSLGYPPSSQSTSCDIWWQWEKFPFMLNWFPECDTVHMGIFPYMSHDWLAWVLFITAWHGGREARSNFFTCCDILGPFLHFG